MTPREHIQRRMDEDFRAMADWRWNSVNRGDDQVLTEEMCDAVIEQEPNRVLKQSLKALKALLF